VALQTIGICKDYPGTVALQDVSVRFEAGKVSALLGKNGAGKSTLVKILAGTLQPTAGQINLNNKVVRFSSAADAFRHGIATVYQEMSLIPGLSVAENIFLGRMPRRFGCIDWPKARADARALLAEMGAAIDVTQPVAQLGVARQQVVEIAKATSFRPAVLMLDEPTSALARHESEMLFAVIKRLAARGVAVIHITHRLHELSQIADTVTVLRNGKLAGQVDFRTTSSADIVRMIFGEALPQPPIARPQAAGETLLEVRGLSRRNKLHDINLSLHRGEILGIAGMVGSGRTELLRAIFGADPFDRGEILLESKHVAAGSLRRMKRLGLGLIPENRKEQSLVLAQSIRTNLCLASLGAVGHFGLITSAWESAVTRRYVQQLAIKLADISLPIASLSGGNQQKVVVGKWLNTKPRVLLFDEPTRGIDLQAKQQIFQIMRDLSREGLGCIFVSSELEELVEVCHRVLIMKEGRITEEVDPARIGVEELVRRCMEETSAGRAA
jgi:ribose transport system ATP-binding protein